MIQHLNQDLTTARQQVIVHQVNCQGRMGSGVAKAIKEKFPNVYTAYKKHCKRNIKTIPTNRNILCTEYIAITAS